MYKAKAFLSKILFNNIFWQLIFSVFTIGLVIFFIRHEHLELLSIKNQLAKSNIYYLSIGVVFTLLYIVFQAMLYVYCFKAIDKKVSLLIAMKLFLKRNLISVFLPAGGFSSLAFFTEELEEKGVGKSQIHLASTLFGFCGIFSVVIIAFPIIGFALTQYNLQQAELFGFLFLILLTVTFFLFIRSISKKGLIYQWLAKVRPSITVVLEEMVSYKVSNKQLVKAIIVSLGIEVIGIVHLYIAMLALGFTPSWPAAIIGYIVMVILLIASPFLRGMGAIELSLTYLLGQFGFPVIAAATITLLYRFFEFWLPLLAGVISFFTRKDNLLLRLLPALIIFVLGVVNIISAITPAIPSRLRLIHHILPEELIATSNTLVLVFGLLLVILSVFLFKGSKRAWYAGLLLTGLSVAAHLLKAGDYEEAILASVAAVSLLLTKSSYKLKPHPKLTKVSYLVFLYSLIVVLIYGVIGFYFIDKRHFGIDFHWLTALKTVAKLFFLFDESGIDPKTHFAQNFLYSIYISGGLVLAFIVYGLLRPYFSKPYNSEEDYKRAKALVQKYGCSALDYFKTYPDKFIFFTEDRDGFISFKMTRHFAFALEDPVCKNESAFKELVKSFDQFCHQNGFVSIYYRIPQQSLSIYKELDKKYIPIGEEAVLDLKTYTLDGGKMKTTRSAINRLTAEGFVIKIYTAPIKEGLMQKIEQVSDKWLKELNQKETAFTQGVFDRSILKEQTIITVEDQEEKVYAFLNIVPDYAPGEATYDLIRKINDAPNGVLDMLLAKTLMYFKEQGYEYANMGLAPLSGLEGENLTEKTIKYAYDNLKIFGHFKGLRKYKDKFHPLWKKKYLVYNHNYHLLQAPNALRKVSEGT